MKSILSLLILAGMTASLCAAPYIVYTGTGTTSVITQNGTTKVPVSYYVLADVADTSNFAVLQINNSTHTYSILARPLLNPAADEAINNFFGGITAADGKSGIAALRFATETTDYQGNVSISRAYATGPLSLKPVTLVAARANPVVVTPKGKGTSGSTAVTFAASPALTSGNLAIPMSLKGNLIAYDLPAAGGISLATQPSPFSVTEQPGLTTVVNIGGPYTVNGSTFPMNPVDLTGTPSESSAFAVWLMNFADNVISIQEASVPIASTGNTGSGSSSGSNAGPISGGYSGVVMTETELPTSGILIQNPGAFSGGHSALDIVP